ncbi:MAG: V-type ATP synthase subunit I [bacterium]
MAVSNVIKIKLIGRKQDEDAIIERLQGLKIMEIERLKEEKNTNVKYRNSSEIEYGIAEIKFAMGFLSEFSTEKKSLKQLFSGTKIEIDYAQLCNFAKDYNWHPIVLRIKNLEAKMNKSKNELEELIKNEEILKPWQSLEDNPENSETMFTKIVFGTISEKKYLNLVQRFNKIKFADVRKINEISKEAFVEIIYRKEFEKEVKSILENIELKEVSLPCQGFNPKKSIENLHQKIREKNEEIIKLKNEARELAGEFKNLKIIFDFLELKKERMEEGSFCARTNSTFCIMGWIEEKFAKRLISDIKRITPYFSVSKVKIKDAEERPVVIYNHPYWRPFESVTNIYGLPKYNEADPTPFLAPFFILFFALCLTDAVYGLFLAIVSFSAIKFLGVPRENQRLIKLLGIGGVVTFVVGALFGGWLGITIENLPTFIARPLMAVRLIDPLQNILLILGFTLALGIIQIYFGILVSFYWKLKQKEIKEAFLADGVWLYFLPVICAFGLSKFGIIKEGFESFVTYLFYSGIILIILTGGRKQKKPILKLLGGVVKLYSLVGYLSDVLSYSRLLALGLATGIIAMVINLIAGIAFKSVPYVGILFAALILIVGHIFNIIINVLGAFIHSGRLQFVEFFPKFMEGGGRRFRPFGQNTEFIKITNEN